MDRGKAMVPGVPETFPFQVVSGTPRQALHSGCQETFHSITPASSRRTQSTASASTGGAGVRGLAGFVRKALVTHLLLSLVLRFHAAQKSSLSAYRRLTRVQTKEAYSNQA